MKRMKMLLLMGLLGMSAMMSSCKDETNDAPQSLTTTPQEKPTTDEMSVTSDLYTYVFAHAYTEVPARLVDRMKNRTQTLDERVKTVILHNDHIASLKDEDYKMLLKIFANDGNIVVVTPTISQWNAFVSRLVGTIDELISANDVPAGLSDHAAALMQSVRTGITKEENTDNKTLYVYDGDEEHADEHFCDMVVLRDNDLYYLADLNDADLTTTAFTMTTVDENGNPVSDETVTENKVVNYTDYDYGKQADLVTAWINEQPNQKIREAARMQKGRALMSTRAGLDDLASLVSAQSQYYQFNVNTVSMFWSVATATVIYDIWAVNDLSKHEDYYLVHQQVTSNNGQLRCGPEDAKYWFERDYNGHSWMGYGGYMKVLETSNSLSGNNISRSLLSNVNPGTTEGSTSFTSGISWSLGGSVGIGSTGVSGGVEFSKSWTTSIPDLRIDQNNNGSSPSWKYVGNSPEAHARWHYEHDAAPGILQNTCTVNNVWIWRQPNPSGAYTLSSSVNVQTEILAYRTKGLWWSGSTYFTQDNKHDYNIWLAPPSRAVQKWSMMYSSANNVDQYLKELYPEYWKPSLTLYTLSDDDTDAVKAYFAKFTSILKNDVNRWKGNGHSGRYLFSIKREGSSQVFLEFELNVP